MKPVVLECREVSLALGGKSLCHALSFAVHSGECWALLGPNGAGKTTLLSALAGLRKTQSGRILVRNESLDGRPSRELARYRAFLPQHTYDEFGGTVLETALTGRHPHLGRWHWESEEDERIACAALDAMGLTPEVAPSRDVTTLSGGERQRLALAAMLAQAPQLMLLDEPLAHLDVRHQMRVLDVLRRMVRDENKTVVVVLHEVNLAVRLCDHALLMRDGEVRCGPRDTMLTAANLEWLYQQPMLEARVPGDPLAYFTPR